jgi:hypothetical protein
MCRVWTRQLWDGWDRIVQLCVRLYKRKSWIAWSDRNVMEVCLCYAVTEAVRYFSNPRMTRENRCMYAGERKGNVREG